MIDGRNCRKVSYKLYPHLYTLRVALAQAKLTRAVAKTRRYSCPVEGYDQYKGAANAADLPIDCSGMLSTTNMDFNIRDEGPRVRWRTLSRCTCDSQQPVLGPCTRGVESLVDFISMVRANLRSKSREQREVSMCYYSYQEVVWFPQCQYGPVSNGRRIAF